MSHIGQATASPSLSCDCRRGLPSQASGRAGLPSNVVRPSHSHTPTSQCRTSAIDRPADVGRASTCVNPLRADRTPFHPRRQCALSLSSLSLCWSVCLSSPIIGFWLRRAVGRTRDAARCSRESKQELHSARAPARTHACTVNHRQPTVRDTLLFCSPFFFRVVVDPSPVLITGTRALLESCNAPSRLS